MENRRSRVTIRRHTSLPDPLRRATFLRSRPRNSTFRSSPYVGWFRHSPSLTEARYSAANTSLLKDSPYVGWFRHAPSTNFLASCYTELSQELVSTVSPKRYGDVFLLPDLISGHLKGGSGKRGSHSLHNQNSTLVAHRVLARLSTWLMTPFREEEFESAPKHIECEFSGSVDSDEKDNDSSSEDESVDGYSSGEESDHDDCDGTCSSLQRRMDQGLSSQAEAYFTHQYTSDLLMDDSSQLDQVITQMDIMRMTRNASRHLDVESIFKLPTMVYRSRNQTRTTQLPPSIPEDKEDASSWMMVQQGSSASQITAAAEPPATVSSQQHQHQPSLKEEDACVICLERFEYGDHLRVLPCNHSFHVGCIDRWLSGSHSAMECDTSGCPTCKSRPTTAINPTDDDGAVPSWAFAQIGSAMSRSSFGE